MPPRRAAKRKPARKQRKGRKGSSNVPEWASLSVKRSMAAPGSSNGFLGNTLYTLFNTSLEQFPRAVQVGSAYQYYRIKRIALTVKPSYDTYMSAGPTGTLLSGTGKPNFYYMIDKSGSLPNNISLEGLKALGARPKQLDEKNLTVSWAPSVQEAAFVSAGAVGAATSLPAKTTISPWLATNANLYIGSVFVPSGVDHFGIYWYIDQGGNGPAGSPVPTYQVEIEVQFEFKKPLTNLASSVPAVQAVFAQINDSPDGIVGGNDGL